MGLLGGRKGPVAEAGFIVPLPRMSLQPPLAIQQIRNNETTPIFFGYAVNLTREGIFIPTLNPKPQGFRTRIRFLLPRLAMVVEGEVEVVWCRDYDAKRADLPAGMGLKFLSLPEEKKCAIDQFMGFSPQNLR